MGQRVICKHKNGRYYHSEVLELSPTTFYEVVFDDGSYSDNLFPEDIEVSMGLFPESLFMLSIRTDGDFFSLLCSVSVWELCASNSEPCSILLRTLTASDTDRRPKDRPSRCGGPTG